MHATTVTLIADQLIEIMGKEINIHDIKTIQIDELGQIIEIHFKPLIRDHYGLVHFVGCMCPECSGHDPDQPQE